MTKNLLARKTAVDVIDEMDREIIKLATFEAVFSKLERETPSYKSRLAFHNLAAVLQNVQFNLRNIRDHAADVKRRKNHFTPDVVGKA